MNYYYQYEAKSFVGDINLKLDQAYESAAMMVMIIAAILAFGLALFTAIAIRRARPYGIIVAIAQPLGVFAAMKSVLAYASIDFSALEMTVTSSVSMDDAMNKLYEKLGDVFVNDIFPQMANFVLWLSVVSIVTILTIVYVCILFKGCGKALTIPAFIVLLVRFLFVAPINLVSALMGSISVEAQYTWDLVFDVFFLLPLLLIAFKGLIVLLSKNKETAPLQKLKESQLP